ncbi:hypothetical protein C8R43DRAFT_951889 [Mycena crocata]|nr:hypothetical protein C8R43DRAFT_951889 [Mycena crocata]
MVSKANGLFNILTVEPVVRTIVKSDGCNHQPSLRAYECQDTKGDSPMDAFPLAPWLESSRVETHTFEMGCLYWLPRCVRTDFRDIGYGAARQSNDRTSRFETDYRTEPLRLISSLYRRYCAGKTGMIEPVQPIDFRDLQGYEHDELGTRVSGGEQPYRQIDTAQLGAEIGRDCRPDPRKQIGWICNCGDTNNCRYEQIMKLGARTDHATIDTRRTVRGSTANPYPPGSVCTWIRFELSGEEIKYVGEFERSDNETDRLGGGTAVN